MSWLLVLAVLALLSAQRNGDWLYDDCPKSSRTFRNRLKNVPSLREALHMAGGVEWKRFHPQAHHGFQWESCLCLAGAVCPSSTSCMEATFPVEILLLPSSVSQSERSLRGLK